MKRITTILAAAAIAALPLSASAEDGFFEGKTIINVVPYSAGGGTTVTGHFLSRWLEKTLKGNPTVQVVNIPGASGVIGSNEYVLKYEHNGYNLLTGAFSSTTPYIFREKGVEYDLSKMNALAAVPAGNVVYVRTDIGVKSVTDLPKAKKLFYAAARPSGGDLIRVFSFELLDIPVTTNYGYDSRSAARVALEQGEATIDVQTAPSYIKNVVPLVKDGIAMPVYTLGTIKGGKVVRDPAFPDIPHTGEVYQMIHGKAPSGPRWDAYKFLVAAGVAGSKVLWIHSDAPQAAIDEIKRAVVKMAADPAFVKDGDKALGGYEMLYGEDLDTLIEVMLNPSDEVKQLILDFIARQK